MINHSPTRLVDSASAFSRSAQADLSDEEMASATLSVLRAGMRARAIADACEAAALPAVLIDNRGRVLHIGRHAEPFIDSHFRMVSGHMVGTSAKACASIERAINNLLTGPAETPVDAPDPADLTVTSLRFHDTSPSQLLYGVLVLSERDARVAAVEALMAA